MARAFEQFRVGVPVDHVASGVRAYRGVGDDANSSPATIVLTWPSLSRTSNRLLLNHRRPQMSAVVRLFKKIDPSRSHSSFAANVAIIWP